MTITWSATEYTNLDLVLEMGSPSHRRTGRIVRKPGDKPTTVGGNAELSNVVVDWFQEQIKDTC